MTIRHEISAETTPLLFHILDAFASEREVYPEYREDVPTIGAVILSPEEMESCLRQLSPEERVMLAKGQVWELKERRPNLTFDIEQTDDFLQQFHEWLADHSCDF